MKTKRFEFLLPTPLWRDLKINGVIKERSMADIIRTLIQEYLISEQTRTTDIKTGRKD